MVHSDGGGGISAEVMRDSPQLYGKEQQIGQGEHGLCSRQGRHMAEAGIRHKMFETGIL